VRGRVGWGVFARLRPCTSEPLPRILTLSLHRCPSGLPTRGSGFGRPCSVCRMWTCYAAAVGRTGACEVAGAWMRYCPRCHHAIMMIIAHVKHYSACVSACLRVCMSACLRTHVLTRMQRWELGCHAMSHGGGGQRRRSQQRRRGRWQWERGRGRQWWRGGRRGAGAVAHSASRAYVIDMVLPLYLIRVS
jgi:hypothetical protein